MSKLPLPELAAMKRDGRPIVMVTAYDYPSGQVASEAGVDLVLVGDSAAMTVLGLDSTVPVTMDEMVIFTRAAARGSTHPLVVADLPFLSYQVDDRDAILNAGRLIKEAGADAVKMEGAGPTISRIRAVAGVGMPVMAHLGLTPQTATALGGFKAQGRTVAAALRLVDDAQAVEAAGAFALVLECVPAPVATAISERLAIPTIGIGAGSGCDGQVLVYHDLLGYGGGKPLRFVRRYADLRGAAIDGVRRYAADVRERGFPAVEHTYPMPAEELAAFEQALEPVRPPLD
jgi:3-methyl-2-oxobutanoate hydroxymethyltransferase